MPARMKNPAMLVPGAMTAIQDLAASLKNGDLQPAMQTLVHLRASQINSCASCIQAGTWQAKQNGETDERLGALANWRDSPEFTDAERAALALTEAVTRLSDRPDPVPDEIWNEAVKHYDEKALATLVLAIATTNVFNRLNVPTRQEPGSWS